ncbi:MAG: TldD/PmbA family protein [Bacilli bacterium]|jgi:TldD protein|nr:TldD/PmbA family protein [Bacilli bacterium]
MISKSLAIDVLNAALATGGDYAEIYLEDTDSGSVLLENGKVETAGRSKRYGAGIRILKGTASVYGYTSDLSKKSLVSLAGGLANRFDGKRLFTVAKIERQRVKTVNRIHDHIKDVPIEDKIALCRECHDVTAGVDKRLVRIQNSFADDFKKIEIFSAEGEIGKQFENTEEHGRLVMAALASDGGKIETSFAGPGRCDGWHWFSKDIDRKTIARQTGEKAIMMLTAGECPSGRFPVVIANGWGGVLFHEACGHSLEATATAKKLSVFSDSVGKQIANPIVSAYDDGTIPNEWGSNNIDSEGHPTQKNQLIKDGVCVGFLVDKFNGRRLNMPANGVSRRQSYRYEPTSRMSNTYIAPGKDKAEDIVKDTKLGVYVANFGGGSVNPTTGEFNFSASEAYIIRDGKICEPVRGCTLIGSGKEVLMNIDRVADDVALGQGMCGSLSGSIPVNVGQPTIRIKEITVGGRGGRLQ